MRNLLGTCLLLLSASLAAQSPLPATVMLQQTSAASCPVSFTAHHANRGGLVSVSPASSQRGQGYRITFAPVNAREVVQARITLRGLAGGQVLQASSNAGAGAAERFTLAPTSGADHRFHSVVYLRKLTGVLSVELNEVTYADGTTWHEAADATCRIAPDGYMLAEAGSREEQQTANRK